jgi:hypothetical protein
MYNLTSVGVSRVAAPFRRIGVRVVLPRSDQSNRT